MIDKKCFLIPTKNIMKGLLHALAPYAIVITISSWEAALIYFLIALSFYSFSKKVSWESKESFFYASSLMMCIVIAVMLSILEYQ